MYKCNNCDCQFDEPKRVKTTHESECGVSGMFPNSTPLEYDVCPSCNENDFDEMKQCAVCEEWFEELIDTEGVLNGGIGDCCSQCCEDADIPVEEIYEER